MNIPRVEDVLEQSKSLFESGKADEAIEILTEAIQSVDDARLYHRRGKAYSSLDYPDHAIADFSDAIDLSPHNATYYLDRGYVFALQLHEERAAIRDFERVLTIDPSNVKAHQQCCLCLLLVGPTTSAMEHAKAALYLAPNDALNHFCLGQAYVLLRQWRDAADSFCRATELDPADPTAWAARGSALREVGKLEGAEDAISRAIELDPKCASYFVSRGGIRLKSGKLNAAKSDLHAALAMGPNENEHMLIDHYLKQLNCQRTERD